MNEWHEKVSFQSLCFGNTFQKGDLSANFGVFGFPKCLQYALGDPVGLDLHFPSNVHIRARIDRRENEDPME
jgi:hypothetical protein